MADGEEEAVDVDIKDSAILAEKAGAGDAESVPKDFLRLAVPQDFDVLRREDLLLHRLRGAEDVAADNHVDLLAEMGQVAGFLAGSIAAAHHCNIFATVEEAVAGCAGADAEAPEFFFAGKAQVFGGCASGDDQGFGQQGGFAVDRHPEGTLGKVDRRHHAGSDIGTEVDGLCAHVGHQLVGIHAVRISGKILDHRGRRQLSTRLKSLIQNGIQCGTRSIYRRRVTCRSAADDQAFCRGFFHILL